MRCVQKDVENQSARATLKKLSQKSSLGLCSTVCGFLDTVILKAKKFDQTLMNLDT